MKLTEPNLRDYRLLRELGRGGMAIVYEAIETSVARQVAIKILPAAASLDDRQSSRFRFEAQVAASLDHPRIVPVYTVGTEDQALFYVMKYIDGRSLAAVVEEMRLPRDENLDEAHMLRVAQWGLQAAEALSYAHARGVVHGDVKPANLLLDLTGDLWLTDFGAARLSAPQAHSPELSPAGTIRYLSPEQVRGESWNIDHRSDVYALGATLFELATLRPALSGDNSSELLRQIAIGTTPRPAWNKSIPARLREIILRAMAADLNARYATAGELAEDLRCFLKNEPTSAGRLRSPIGSDFVRRKRISIAAAGFLAVAVGLASLTYIARRSVAFNLSQQPAAGQEANQRLPSITAQDLDQLADKLARGTSLTEKEAQLIQLGPATDFQSVDSDIEYQEHARYELAKVYDCLATLHGWKHDFAKQEAMLLRSTEQWAALIEQHPFPGYVASAAFSQLMMCEVYAHTNRIQASIELGKQAIGQLEALHQMDPDDSELAVARAYALTRLDLALSEILPPEEAARHRQTVSDFLQSLPEQSDAIPSGNSPGHSDSLHLPFTSLRDALGECRINMAFLVPDLRQAEEYSRSALAELADADMVESVAGRRVGLRARAEQFLGNRLSDSGAQRGAEAETHLGQSAALFQELSAEFPQMVAYRAGLAFALGAFGKSQASAGKVEDGELSMTQAIDLLKGLASQYPNDPEFHHRLAGSLNNLGISLSGAESLASFEEAVRHEATAIRLCPQHREYRRWLAIQYDNLANEYWQAEDHSNAESVWRAAIENADRLAELAPASYDDRHRLAHNWLALGESLTASGSSEHEQEAAQAFGTASELFRSLFQDSGRKPHDACMLAATDSLWSQLLEKQGNLAHAKQKIEQAIAHELEALQLEPGQAEHNADLTQFRQRLEKLTH